MYRVFSFLRTRHYRFVFISDIVLFDKITGFKTRIFPRLSTWSFNYPRIDNWFKLAMASWKQAYASYGLSFRRPTGAKIILIEPGNRFSDASEIHYKRFQNRFQINSHGSPSIENRFPSISMPFSLIFMHGKLVFSDVLLMENWWRSMESQPRIETSTSVGLYT